MRHVYIRRLLWLVALLLLGAAALFALVRNV